MRLTKMFVSGFIALFCWSGSLYADYTIVLKNGGRITVKRASARTSLTAKS